MPTPTPAPRSTLGTAIAVSLVAAVAGVGYLTAVPAAADPTDLTAELCLDSVRSCAIQWNGGAPSYLDSTTAYEVRVQGNPGVTVQLAMYEILFNDAGEQIGIRQFRSTPEITTGSNGIADQYVEFSEIDRSNPPTSGYGFVGLVGLPEGTTDLSSTFGEPFPMAHARPLVLDDGLDTERPVGQEGTLNFLGGTPGVAYQLWFIGTGLEPRVISHQPVVAQPPPAINTITYTVPVEAGAGNFRLTSSDDYFTPLDWPVVIIGEPEPTNSAGPDGDPEPSGDPDPSGEPDPSGSPDPSSSAPPTATTPQMTTQTTPASTRSTAQPTRTSTAPPTSSQTPATSSQPTSSVPPTDDPDPVPSEFGSAEPEPTERVRTEERVERVPEPATQFEDAPRWSGGLVGGLGIVALIGAAVWVWRSRQDSALVLDRWEDE